MTGSPVGEGQSRDILSVEGLDAMRRAQGGGCNQFKYDLNNYLAAHGDKAGGHEPSVVDSAIAVLGRPTGTDMEQ